MEYEKEFEKIQEGAGETFRPTIGIHQLVILEEPTETEYVDGENVTPQIKLLIEINKERKNWYISKGTTLKSLYGQLMALGKYKSKLMGELITLSVTSTTNRNGEKVNSYQVIEAVKILPELEKLKEEMVL